MLGRIVRAASWVFFGVLLGRIFGLARELIIAHYFGATSSADMVVLVLTVPDALTNILIGGALGAALIPEFTRLGSEAAWELFREATWKIFASLGALVLLFSIFASLLVRQFAPGLDSNLVGAATVAVALVLWVIPFTGVGAVDQAFLQYKETFAVSALTSAVYNLFLIVGLVWGARSNLGISIAIAGVAGAFIGWIMQRVLALKHRTAPLTKRERLFGRALLIRYVEALLAGSLVFILPPIARSFASGTGEGNMAIFYYAIKIVELPLGVVLTVFSVALLPYLSKAFNHDRHHEGVRISHYGLQSIFVTAVSFALCLAAGAHALTSLLYGHGKLTDPQVSVVAHLATIGMIGLAAQAIITIQLAVLNARLDTRSPFWASCAGVAVFFVFAFLLRPSLGLPGVYVALVAAYWSIVGALFYVLAAKHKMPLLSQLLQPESLRPFGTMLIICVPFLIAIRLLSGKPILATLVLMVGCVVPPLVGLLRVEPYRSRILPKLRGLKT